MTAAFYLLGLAALLAYINVHTRADYFSGGWRLNVTFYGWQIAIVASIAAAIFEVAR